MVSLNNALILGETWPWVPGPLRFPWFFVCQVGQGCWWMFFFVFVGGERMLSFNFLSTYVQRVFVLGCLFDFFWGVFFFLWWRPKSRDDCFSDFGKVCFQFWHEIRPSIRGHEVEKPELVVSIQLMETFFLSASWLFCLCLSLSLFFF